MEKEKKYIIATIVFIAVLVLMLVLLVTVGKSAFIENLPMWVAYALLFIVNFQKSQNMRRKKMKHRDLLGITVDELINNYVHVYV